MCLAFFSAPLHAGFCRPSGCPNKYKRKRNTAGICRVFAFFRNFLSPVRAFLLAQAMKKKDKRQTAGRHPAEAGAHGQTPGRHPAEAGADGRQTRGRHPAEAAAHGQTPGRSNGQRADTRQKQRPADRHPPEAAAHGQPPGRSSGQRTDTRQKQRFTGNHPAEAAASGQTPGRSSGQRADIRKTGGRSDSNSGIQAADTKQTGGGSGSDNFPPNLKNRSAACLLPVRRLHRLFAVVCCFCALPAGLLCLHKKWGTCLLRIPVSDIGRQRRTWQQHAGLRPTRPMGDVVRRLGEEMGTRSPCDQEADWFGGANFCRLPWAYTPTPEATGLDKAFRDVSAVALRRGW